MKKELRLKTSDDIKRIGESGRIIAEIFKAINKISLPDISTLELNDFIENIIHKSKARPSFKTVPDYSHATCISVNNEVVHGIPSKDKIIKKGDIVKIDIGVVKSGYFSDGCWTFAAEYISGEAENLINTAHEALELGIEAACPGGKLQDIGFSIEPFVESRGYSIVRDFAGHGVGFAVHEPPPVPHYSVKKINTRLVEGMVLAIEPILNENSPDVRYLDNGWTAVTEDGKLSAQFEHTVAVTKHGPVVLTELV
ncbi:MAG: type I methionyl aminopeptidase [Spirochaetes bacterium]|nr:type I methionyl aminopeptidase [Spirochaetota bacterium]